jgi:hypothetical protein
MENMDQMTIIDALGGLAEVAKLCEVTPQAVSQWHGNDPQTGEPRFIPKPRLMYLQAIRPEVFKKLAEQAQPAA